MAKYGWRQRLEHVLPPVNEVVVLDVGGKLGIRLIHTDNAQ